MEHVVGMGEYIITGGEDDILRTYALASCVAVTAYSPLKKAAGMLHVVLPSPLDERDRTGRPGYFAETGVPLMISTLCQSYGCRKEELHIQLYGGAESMLPQDIYNVGKKNIDAVKHALLSMGLTITKADLRGSESRTIALDVKTGTVEIFRQPILR